MDVSARLSAALADRYRIERELGAGGMATVYLAEDLKHRRKVALKVLKPELAAVVGAERFLGEIETTAQLQHPQILPLFDSGQADSFLFYVMPYVEGDTLRDKLDREKQLAVDEAVRIAAAVASALDYAHRHKVIHRDIKPANILLQDGQPVVADFGIALAVGAAGGSRLTETGLSLGTPYYMSPEQATGDQVVGPATDVYALGCVLYEMLVGEPPYLGNTAQAVLGRIIAGGPISATRIRPTIPAHIDAVIRRALEKVPADRFASAHDFAKALADRSFRHGEPLTGEMHARGRGRLRFAAAAGWGIAAILAVTAVSRAFAKPEPVRVARFALSLPPEEELVPSSGVNLAWAPDGSRFVYVGPSETATQLWQRSLDQVAPQPIPGSEGARNPSVSPDASSVAFTSGGSLKTVSLRGGPAFTVVAVGVPDNGTGTDWGPDGVLYFTDAGGALNRVPASGGTPEKLTTPEPNTRHAWVDALPEGKGVLFTITRGGPETSTIAAMPRDGGTIRTLFAAAMARYAGSGHVVYTARDGTLMAAPFDPDRLEVTGPAVALVQGVDVYSGSASQFALSETGALIYVAGSRSNSQLVRVARDGSVEEIEPTWTGPFGTLALSPDGKKLAVSIGRGTGLFGALSPQDVWIKQLDNGPLSKLTFEGTLNFRPSWTPDGRALTFVSNRADSAGADLWTAPADGTGTAERVLSLDRPVWDAVWSARGDWLVASTGVSGSPWDIVGIRPGVDTLVRRLVATVFGAPALSPDGRWLAYVSNESGRGEIYVRPFPNADDGRWQISTAGGAEPLWAHSGRELFYRDAQANMVAVAVSGSSAFQSGSPRLLFSSTGYARDRSRPGYAVTPDDQHFIMIRPVTSGVQVDLNLVQNFFEELEARVPR